MKLETVYLMESVVSKVALGVIGIAGIIGISSLATVFTAERLEEQKKEAANRAYTQALVQYADKNKDGFVSATEQDEFDSELMKDKGVTLIHGRFPKFADGKEVSLETIMSWINNYKPETK